MPLETVASQEGRKMQQALGGELWLAWELSNSSPAEIKEKATGHQKYLLPSII